MKIKNAKQKAVLAGLYIVTNPQGQRVERSVPLDDLLEAVSAKKKLFEGSTEVKNKAGMVTGVDLTDTEIEFSDVEVKVLKKWFDGTKEWTVENGEQILELKEMFK